MRWRRKADTQWPGTDIIVEAMEPRLLLSADALGIDAGVLDRDAHEQPAWDIHSAADWWAGDRPDQADAHDVAPVGEDDAATRREIVFLDAGVADGDSLLQDLLADDRRSITQIHLIDGASDGIGQISQVLAGQQGIDAIHIISHGAAGQIQLGSGTLSTGSLDGYAGQLNDWGSAIADSGDILIYGCDLAADAQGEALVNAIGILTGADVAASVDPTGHAAQGGDWALEYTRGQIEAVLHVAPQAQWQQVLALHAYDGFDYPTGSLENASGGTGWDVASDWTTATGTSAQVVAGGLVDPSGSLPVTGGAAEMNAGLLQFIQTRDMTVTLGSAGTTAWASFLLEADVAPGQGISLHLGDSSDDRVTVGTVNDDFIITRNGSTIGASWINNVVNDAQTYLLVVRMDFAAGADTVTLYVDPTPGLSGPDVAAGAVLSSAELGTFKEIGMIGGGFGNVSTIDEIRVGDSFADVAPAIDTGSLWFTTSGDVGSHTGQTGSVASWEDNDAVELGGPGFTLEPGTTAGTFSVPFDPGSFSGGAKIDALHYVTSASVVVGSGTTITLNAGDVLFSTEGDGETFTSSNVLSGVNNEDLIFFRPDTPGDYSAGAFTMLLQNPTGDDIEAIALVERDTTIGDHTVAAGSFLFADANDGNDVQVYIPGTVGAGSTGGATIQTLIDGDELNGASDEIIEDDIRGIALVETNSELGGTALAQGDLLLAMRGDNKTVGDNSLTVDNQDVTRLQVSKTTLVNGTTESSAALLLEGSDIGLGGGSAEFVGLSIASWIATGDNDPLFQAAGPYSVDENAAATTVVGDVDADDGDGGAADVGITYGITGNLDPDNDGRKAFAIDPFSGVITVNDADDLNFEDNTSLTITVEADDGSKTASTDVTIDINNVNEAPSVSVPGAVFINEIHYDNMGVDSGEAIEIAGVAGNDLNGWTLVMYNGFNGTAYDSVNLSGTLPNQADNFGTLVFGFPVDGIQNATGNPDGIALVDPTGSVVQFLSYEGVFTATDGPANGMLSTDIGVSEDNATTAVGESLQLTGAGAAFTWTGAAADTFGAINAGQDFAAIAAATAQTINEDGSLVFSSGNGNAITVGDVDAGAATLSVQLDVGNGTLTLGDTAGLVAVAGDGSGSVTFSGTLSELNDALEGLTYQPFPHYNGGDTLALSVNDLGSSGAGGNQVTDANVFITIAPVNDAPTSAGTYTLAGTDESTPSVAVQVGSILGDASITAGDVDGDTLGIAVFAKSGLGTWQYSTNGASGWTAFGAVDPNAAVLLSETSWIRYVPDGANGETADFNFRAWDRTAGSASVNGTPALGDTTPGGGTTPYATATAQVSVTVTPVNDPPTATNLTSTSAYNEGDATVAITDIVVSDADAAETVTATLTLADTGAGSLSANDGASYTAASGVWTITDSVANVNSALANLLFIPLADNDADTTINVAIDDGDEDNSGPLTGSITLDVTPVNDEQVLATNAGVTVNEGSSGNAITSAMLETTDVDNTVVQLRYTLLSAPANGTLRLSGAALAATDSFTQDDIDNGRVSYDHDGSETAADGFRFSVDDGSGAATVGSFGIAVTAQNDVPTLVNPMPDQSATEEIAFSFQFASATFDDVDPGDSLSYTAQLAGGVPLPAWLGFDGATRTFSGTPDDADVGVLSIRVTATDGSGATATDTFDLTVIGVNDAPVIGSNSMLLNDGDTVVLTAAILSAGDVDNADPGLLFSVSGVSGGQFELSAAPGVAVTSFTQAQVAAGDVLFVDDADGAAPGYSVSVSDGSASAGPFAASVFLYSPAAPTLPPVAATPAATAPPDPAAAEPEPEPDAEPDAEAAPDEPAPPVDTPVAEVPGEDESAIALSGDALIVPDARVSSSAAVSQAPGLLQSLLRPLAPPILTEAFQLDGLSSEIRAVLASSGFNDSLNRMRDEVSHESFIQHTVIGSSVAVSTGLSVGYVAWLVRGGVLLSTALSSLPAWQFVDPLPVLARTRDADDADGDADDSLETIIKDQSDRAANGEGDIADQRKTVADSQTADETPR